MTLYIFLLILQFLNVLKDQNQDRLLPLSILRTSTFHLQNIKIFLLHNKEHSLLYTTLTVLMVLTQHDFLVPVLFSACFFYLYRVKSINVWELVIPLLFLTQRTSLLYAVLVLDIIWAFTRSPNPFRTKNELVLKACVYSLLIYSFFNYAKPFEFFSVFPLNRLFIILAYFMTTSLLNTLSNTKQIRMVTSNRFNLMRLKCNVFNFCFLPPSLRIQFKSYILFVLIACITSTIVFGDVLDHLAVFCMLCLLVLYELDLMHARLFKTRQTLYDYSFIRIAVDLAIQSLFSLYIFPTLVLSYQKQDTTLLSVLFIIIALFVSSLYIVRIQRFMASTWTTSEKKKRYLRFFSK